MSQTFNNTFTINWGSNQTSSKSESITLEPTQRLEDGTRTLYELKTTVPNVNQTTNTTANLTLENAHAYNIALLDCQWDGDWITGIESFAFDEKSAKNYPMLPSSDDDYYGNKFFNFLLELQKIYEDTGDGYRLSRLFDRISLEIVDGHHSYNYKGSSYGSYYKTLGLAEWNIEGTEYHKKYEPLVYNGVAVPETMFFKPGLFPEEYNDFSSDVSNNIYHPSGGAGMWRGLHFILPQSNSFTLLVIPENYCALKHGTIKDRWGNETFGETFTIEVWAFKFHYKIFDGKVIALKNVDLTKYAYTHPVPFQISGGSIIYHNIHTTNAKVQDIGGNYPGYFKLRHIVYATTARWISDNNITVLDPITQLEQLEYNNLDKLLLNGKQIYIKTSEKVLPFRNVGRVTTRYTLSDQYNRTPTISPGIKQVEKLVLRPENYLSSGNETCFSLDNNANINITSPNLSIKRIVLNGLLTISEDD